MDISRTTEPRSDQLNFDDVAAKDLTVTVVEVKRGSAEQPVELHNAEFPGRPYKPGKSMRRVLVAAWGSDSAAYTGRQLTLYGDPDIRFGGAAVGGIRISHLSHIDKPLTIALTVTRGKRAPFTVQPLESAADEWIKTLQAATTLAQLQAAWKGADAAGVATDPEVLAAKDKRKAELA